MSKRRRYTSRSRAPSRRWHIPPPLIHGPEALEGGAILEEWSGELGVTLWQAARDAMLWATSEPEGRVGAFAAGARPLALPTEVIERDSSQGLRSGLKILQQLVTDPRSLREDQVARACKAISDWAYEQGRLRTALAFAQNAALAMSTSPSAAFWVAEVAGRLNDHARAEGWFRRAVGLARQGRDWRMYSRAFRGLGNLYIRRGNLPAARRLHTRALRGARRGGMRSEQAASLHDLFAVAVETGNIGEAEKLARQALEAFGLRNRRIHILAHDVAYFWMEQGHFARALAVFQAVLPLVDHRVERVLVLANVARAAGGIGDEDTTNEAAAKVEKYLAEPELRIAGGRALLEVARGYLALGELARAEKYALATLGFASEFRENKIQFAAESVLSAIREQTAVAPQRTRQPAPYGNGDELAAEFVRTLEAVAGATH